VEPQILQAVEWFDPLQCKFSDLVSLFGHLPRRHACKNMDWRYIDPAVEQRGLFFALGSSLCVRSIANRRRCPGCWHFPGATPGAKIDAKLCELLLAHCLSTGKGKRCVPSEQVIAVWLSVPVKSRPLMQALNAGHRCSRRLESSARSCGQIMKYAE